MPIQPVPTPRPHAPPTPYRPVPHRRYRVTAAPDWHVERVKQALFSGGIARANKPEHIRNTPGIQVGACGRAGGRGASLLVKCLQLCERVGEGQ